MKRLYYCELEIRDHLSRDLVFRTRRVCGVSAYLHCPAVKTDRVRVDWPWPTTLSDKLGPRQSGLRSRGGARGIRDCRRQLADPRKSLHADEGLGPESHRLGDLLAKLDSRAATSGLDHLTGQHPSALALYGWEGTGRDQAPLNSMVYSRFLALHLVPSFASLLQYASLRGSYALLGSSLPSPPK